MDYSMLFAIEKVAIQDYEKVENSNEPELEIVNEIEFEDNFDRIDFEKHGNSVISKGRHMYHSSCGNFIYHLAIIDYLQEFNFEKWSESKFKIWVLRRPETLISAVDPGLYGDRFIKFMKSELLLDSILDLDHEKNINPAMLSFKDE